MGHSKSTYAPRGEGGGGDTLKAYGNVQGEGGDWGKAYVRYRKIANNVGDFSPNINMIKQVCNLLISCLASSTNLSVGFKSMTYKYTSMDEWCQMVVYETRQALQ